ncbi:MAG: hypothetical protein ACM3MF_11560, partial [Anaerolineae bacterium]
MLALLGVGYQIAPRLAAPLAPAPAEPTAAVPAPTALPTPTSRAVAWPEPGDETGDACAPDRRVASEELRHATIYVYCGVNSCQ